MLVGGGAVQASEANRNKALYYMRHGERLDENKGDLWGKILHLIQISRQKQLNISAVAAAEPGLLDPLLSYYDLHSHAAELLLYVDKLYPLTSARSIDDIYYDSILTPNSGRQNASKRAELLEIYFKYNELIPPTEIHCSALIRAVETAVEVSTAFDNVPIYVSKSLASSALKVHDGEIKTFHTINEMRSLFPAHQIYCCDEGFDIDGNNAHGGSVANIQTLAYGATEEFRNSDVYAVKKIVTNSSNQNVLIVGHREGIRNIWHDEELVNKNKPLPHRLQYVEVAKFDEIRDSGQLVFSALLRLEKIREAEEQRREAEAQRMLTFPLVN